MKWDRDRCSCVRISTDAAVNSGKRLAWRCTEPAAGCGIGLHDEEGVKGKRSPLKIVSPAVEFALARPDRCAAV